MLWCSRLSVRVSVCQKLQTTTFPAQSGTECLIAIPIWQQWASTLTFLQLHNFTVALDPTSVAGVWKWCIHWNWKFHMWLIDTCCLRCVVDVRQSHYPAVRSMRDIAADLSRSTSSLHSSTASDGIDQGSARSLNAVISADKTDRTPSQHCLVYGISSRVPQKMFLFCHLSVSTFHMPNLCI